jgi:hypothetical protein
MHTFTIIEDDRGTISGTRHPHNGYYAGDFAAHTKSPSSGPGTFAVVRTAVHPSERRAA